jgi:hypothetical protein
MYILYLIQTKPIYFYNHDEINLDAFNEYKRTHGVRI